MKTKAQRSTLKMKLVCFLASKLAFTLAAAICTNSQKYSTQCRCPKALLPQHSLLCLLMNEERLLLKHAIIGAFQGQLEPRKQRLWCQRKFATIIHVIKNIQ